MNSFDAVKTAIADAETAENDYESKSAANDTAQSALSNAQQTAEQAKGALADATAALTGKLDTLKDAIVAFESGLNPAAPPAGPQ